ncbi:MAG: hypothetical protein ACR2IQ_00015 [Minisyncoccia bacterium]
MDKFIEWFDTTMTSGTEKLGGVANVILTIIAKAIELILFAILAVFFIPSFLIVTYLNKTWGTLLTKLFKL